MVYTFEQEEEKLAADALAQMQNWTFASLFNLIAVADSPEQTIRCQEIVKLVTEKFPCRVILIQTDPASETDFFHVSESIQSIGSEKNRVCFEQITIESSPNELRKAPFVILPKLLADLPVYILLGHDPMQDQVIVPALQKYASRIVFDSQSIESIEQFAKRMLAAMPNARNDFVDIIWAKTKGWREILLRICNDAEKVSMLQATKMLQISYCSHSAHTSTKQQLQAVYLQAWLAARLGWTFVQAQKENGSFRVHYSRGAQSIQVSLIAKDTEALEPGELFSCEITTYDDNHVLISYEGVASQVTVHASSTERCEMPYSLFVSNYQKGAALVNEALYQPQSEHYISMLGMLNHSAWGM